MYSHQEVDRYVTQVVVRAVVGYRLDPDWETAWIWLYVLGLD